MKKTRKTRKRVVRQTNAERVKYDGVEFRSKLELYMYKSLKKNKIPFSYEGKSFVIIEGFKYEGKSYERFLNGKGEFKDRGKKTFRDMVYTPDFTPPEGEPLKWVIEIKGRSMPDFSRTWKLFKKWIVKNKEDTVLFVPRRQSDCDEVIKLINQMNG